MECIHVLLTYILLCDIIEETIALNFDYVANSTNWQLCLPHREKFSNKICLEKCQAIKDLFI